MQNESATRRDLLKALSVLGFAFPEAHAQDAVEVDPRGYKVMLDNDKVRVVEHSARPRMGVCGTGMHSHPSHVSVCLTDIKAKVTLPDGKTFVAENKAGDVFWEPAGTHAVENIGARDVKAYLIEIKGA
jgi:beta-alanine degradation protein BauB